MSFIFSTLASVLQAADMRDRPWPQVEAALHLVYLLQDLVPTMTAAPKSKARIKTIADNTDFQALVAVGQQAEEVLTQALSVVLSSDVCNYPHLAVIQQLFEGAPPWACKAMFTCTDCFHLERKFLFHLDTCAVSLFLVLARAAKFLASTQASMGGVLAAFVGPLGLGSSHPAVRSR